MGWLRGANYAGQWIEFAAVESVRLSEQWAALAAGAGWDSGAPGSALRGGPDSIDRYSTGDREVGGAGFRVGGEPGASRSVHRRGSEPTAACCSTPVELFAN